MAEITNTGKVHPAERPVKQDVFFNEGNILKFGLATSGLLDNLHLHAFIVQDGIVCYSNREPGASESLFIKIKQVISSENPVELCLRLCRGVVKTSIFENGSTGFMEIDIRYNGMPANLFLVNSCCPGFSFTGYVVHTGKAAGIRRLLIVDDNPDVLDAYGSMLSMMGYETFPFIDPHEALIKMESADFDLLITDYDMPGMTGFELCRNFSIKRPGLPVIIMSGSADFPGSIKRSECCGLPLSFMRKPFMYDNLCGMLEVTEFFFTLESYCRQYVDSL